MSDKAQARPEPVKPVKKAAPKADPVTRAGGYVNRDDGRGWVLEGE